MARSAGTVVLAGPNTAADLVPVLDRLADYGAQLALVDGAINRIMPMSATDGLILATGAARNPDIARLAEETRAIARLFTLPECEAPIATPDGITLVSDGAIRATLPASSILTVPAAQSLAESTRRLVSNGASLIIPGQASAAAIETLATALPGVNIVVTDPLKLLLAGEPAQTLGALEAIAGNGGRAAVLHTLPLLAITVNPFYPRFRHQRGDYEPAYVDADKLWSAIHNAVEVPVVDVMRHGAANLLQWATHHCAHRI